MVVGRTAALFPAVALLLSGAALAEIEIVSGPGDNLSLVCNESWIAWRNNTAPFYDLLVYPYIDEVETNGTFVNMTFFEEYIQVLEGSMPIIFVEYFEEGENGTLGRPVICFNPPGSPEEEAEEVDSTPLVVVIYITSSLSIIASLVALATYSLLPRLRTLPGLVMMNLFLSFLLGEIMLQVRIGFEYNGHYHLVNYLLSQGLLISRFFWMSIAGFEMCRSLYRGIKMRLHSSSQTWVVLGVYMAIGWGTSVVLTIIMAVVETRGGEEMKRVLGIFGYLTNHTPVAVTQLVNIGALVFISGVIVTASRRQRRVRDKTISKQNVNFVRLFIVLLTVLGLIWLLFSILAFIPEADAQRPGVIITYVIVTDTQPLLVCAAFVCTPKVFKMCLVRLHIRTPQSARRRRDQTATIISYASSSERGFERETTNTSLISFTNLPTTEKASPTLKAIVEEDEREEETQMAVGNGNGVGGGVGGAAINGGLQCPSPSSMSDGVREVEEPAVPAVSSPLSGENSLSPTNSQTSSNS